MTTRKAVGDARLAKLAKLLEDTKFEKGKFNLGSWMTGYTRMLRLVNGNDPAIARRADETDQTDSPFEKMPGGVSTVMPISCKTAGCAVGWGIAMIPSFRKAGLELYCDDKVFDGDSGSGVRLTRKTKDGAVYEYTYDMEAVQTFFGLDPAKELAGENIIELLFIASSYKAKDRANPKAVAKRIRTYLDKGEAALRRSVAANLRPGRSSAASYTTP